jgi:hypothetical protein
VLSVVFLLPNLVAWLVHLKVMAASTLACGDDGAYDADSWALQGSLKEMQRHYGKSRTMGMYGYCVL